MKRTNTHLETAICTANAMEEFQTWKQRRSKNAMFRSTLNYMHRADVVLFCVAASRNAEMTLILQQGSSWVSCFSPWIALSTRGFGHDTSQICMTLGQRVLPRGMNLLAEVSHSSKNGIPFTYVGADHAYEHLNRQMKVKSGLVGISNNVDARQMFFLATPEMSRMSTV